MSFNHPVKSFYSVRDAINYAEEHEPDDDENFIDMVEILPPVNELTDEEDFDDEILDDEERDESFILQDVPGSVELHRYDNEEPTQPQCKRKKSPDLSWEKIEPSFSKFVSPTTNGANDRMKSMKDELLGKSPVDMFELFLDDELLKEICKESVTYSAQKNVHDFSLSTNCLRIFFGILFFSGYHRLPSERNYWSLDEDFDTQIIRKTMPRNRFLSIKRYLHFVNNENAENSKDDKGFKIRSLADALNQKFKQFGIFSKELSIDEQIVRYYGRSSLKQFIRGKPIRFGFKQWMLCCGTSGYCYQMDLYQGKQKNSTTSAKKNDSLGSRVVLSMVSHLEDPQDHEVYVDNFFSSFGLFVQMKSLKIRITGTIRSNRTSKCPLETDKSLQKKDRGSYDYRYEENEELFFLKWHDNSIFTIGSNHQSVDPVGNARRWSSKSGKKIFVSQPFLISQYNKYMGGVDHLDWLIQKYRISIRSKKWYFSLFTSFLDTVMVNSWIIYCIVNGNNMKLLDFRRSVTRAYLQLSSDSDPKTCGRPKVFSSKVLPDIKFSTDGHILDRTEGGKQRKCAFCKKKVSKQCAKCNVGLHIGECFRRWHTK